MVALEKACPNCNGTGHQCYKCNLTGKILTDFGEAVLDLVKRYEPFERDFEYLHGKIDGLRERVINNE